MGWFVMSGSNLRGMLRSSGSGLEGGEW
jgi:hypothetical protein